MKKLILHLVVLILFVTVADAQVAQIGTGTSIPGNTLYGPIYRFSGTTTTDYGRANTVYTSAEMLAAGIPAGAQITKLAFFKVGAGATLGNATFNILMANSATIPPLATTTTWADIIGTHTQVYANATQTIPATTGWIEFTLDAPFIYTGGSLEIAFDWNCSFTTPNPTTDKFDWQFTPGFATSIIGASGSTTPPATLNGAVAAYKERPNIQITYIGLNGLNASLNGIGVGATTCPGTYPVSVNLANSGTVDIDSAIVNWSVNGVAQTPYVFYGPLASAQSTALTLGNATFTAGTDYDLQATLADVNGQGPDSIPDFDTSTILGLQTGLVGTYTINSANATSGTNFQTFTALAAALNSKGICGPTTVNVVGGSGPYTETFVLNQITGSSSINTLTINGNGETLQFAPISTAKYIVYLNGTDYVTIDSLTIKSTDPTFGFGVLLSNNAEWDTIRNCTIDLSVITSTTTTNSVGIAASASITSPTTGGTTASNCVFEGNNIIGGSLGGPYYGISLYGTTGAVGCANNKVINNTIRDFQVSGIRTSLTLATDIIGNNISRPNLTTAAAFEGIYLLGLTNPKTMIAKNRIYNSHGANPTSTGTTNGIFIASDGTGVNQAIQVINNAVYDLNGNGITYGIQISGSLYSNYFHNSISLDNASSTTTAVTRAIYLLGTCDTIDVKNNIVSVTRGGTGLKHGLYYTTLPANLKSDFNDVYVESNATSYFGYNGVNQTTIADWLQTSQRDSSSSNVNPLFTSLTNGDLTPAAPAINNIGEDLTFFAPDDINGTLRTTTPDPGAFEFSPQLDNAGITTISTNNCAGVDSVIVTVQNFGAATLNTVTIQASVNGSPLTNSGNLFSVNLASGASTTINMGAVTYVANTVYSIVASTSLPNGSPDSNPSNDTAVLTVNLALNGNYTINSALTTGGTNFQSFTDAASALNTVGLCGPVVITVTPGSGPYLNQQISLNALNTTSVNTLTIKGNLETFSYLSTNTNIRAGIRLNNTGFITLDSLVVIAQGDSSTEFGWAIHLLGSSSNNSILNSFIYVDTATTSTNFAGIVVSNSATSATTSGAVANFNRFEGNTIRGGYYGIINVGTSTSNVCLGNQIRNNKISQIHYYGIYNYNQDSCFVIGNSIEQRVGGSTTSYGISTSYNFRTIISKNKVIVRGTSTSYGIYMTTSNGFSGINNQISNNMISCFGGATTGTIYGIYPFNCLSLDILHNSIYTEGGSATAGRALYLNSSTTGSYGQINVKNNIGVNNGLGYAVEISNAAVTLGYVTSMNNNNWLAAGTVLGRYNNVNHATLAAWTNASQLDSNSLFTNPAFVSTTDLHIASNFLNDKGAIGTGINDDFDGEVRCPNPGCAGTTLRPDIGADEFLGTPITVDLGITALTSPIQKACYTNAESVTVTIKNETTQQLDFTQEPVTISVQVSGVVDSTLSPILINTGTLDGDSSLTVVINPNFDMSVGGLYTFTVIVSNQDDANQLNDTLAINRNFSLGTLAKSFNQVCEGNSVELKLGNLSGPVQWQSFDAVNAVWVNEIGANSDSVAYTVSPTQFTIYRALVCSTYSSPLDTVDVFVTPVPVVAGDTVCGSGVANLSATVTSGTLSWYADAVGGTKLITGNTYSPNVVATDTFYVENADGGAGTETVGPLSPAIGTTSASNIAIGTQRMFFNVTSDVTINSVDIFPTAAIGSNGTIVIRNNTQAVVATVPYTTTVTGGAKQTVTMNVFLTPGNAYEIGQGVAINLNRNTTGAVYPYTSSAVTITGNTFNVAYYYFYYNWQVSSGCQSARVPVVAFVAPTPSVALGADTSLCTATSFALDASNVGSTYLWNDASTNQTLTATTTSNYAVTVTNSFNCSSSDNINVTFGTVPTIDLGADTSVCVGNSFVFDAANFGSTYLWSNGATTQTISVSTANTYSVTVTNSSNCSASDAVVLTSFALPIVDLGNDTTQCGGSVTFGAGNSGSTYLWNDASTAQTFTATQSGTVDVLVTDANGCSNTDTVTVVINTLPVVNLGNDIVQCGGTVTLDAGANAASYLWSDATTAQTLTVTASANITVIITDVNNCIASDTVSVAINSVPVVNLGNDVSQCGGTVTLDAGNAGSNFAWSNAASTQTNIISTSGEIIVTVTTPNNCSVADTVSVTINAIPTVTFTISADTVCTTSGNITLSGMPMGGTFSGTGVTGNTFSPASAGAGLQTITYLYTDANNCSATVTDNIFVDLCLSIGEVGKSLSYKVYPNPTSGVTQLEFSEAPADVISVEVMTIEGKLIESRLATSMITSFDFSSQSAGVYLMRIKTNASVVTHRIIVE
jgi:hypothetical protein